MNTAELVELGPHNWADLTTKRTKQPKNNSTAQPRPAIHVPPRGIGPVQEPNLNDVLCGRGGRINAHAGNVQFRVLVQNRKKEYMGTGVKKLAKAHIAASVVHEIRMMEPAGRFLKEDADTRWYDIGDCRAIKKAGQALREFAHDIPPELKHLGDSSEGSDDKTVEARPTMSQPSDPTTEPAAEPTTAEAAASMLLLRMLLKRKSPCR